MNARERVAETLNRLGVRANQVEYLAGSYNKEIRRQLVWAIDGKKPTLAESRIGILTDKLRAIFEITGDHEAARHNNLADKLREMGVA